MKATKLFQELFASERTGGILLCSTHDGPAYAAMVKGAQGIVPISEFTHRTGAALEKGTAGSERASGGDKFNGSRARDALSTIDRVRKQHPRAYMSWTTEVDARVLGMLSKGMALLAMSEVFPTATLGDRVACTEIERRYRWRLVRSPLA